MLSVTDWWKKNETENQNAAWLIADKGTFLEKRARIVDAAWLTFWLLASSLWCLSAARALGATYDEEFYLHQGLGWWRGDTLRVLIAGTMPLPVDVQTLPIFLWETLRGARFDLQTDFPKILHFARATNLLFWWVLLFYGWRIGRELAGRWGGNFAVAFLAFDPNLLANASLATTDIALAACLLAFGYHYRKGREGDWKNRVLWPMIWLWLACVSKVSAPLFAGTMILTIEVERALNQRRRAMAQLLPAISWRPKLQVIRELGGAILRRTNRRDWAQMVLGALWLTLLYCGSGGQPLPNLVALAAHTPPDLHGQVVRWMADHVRLYPSAVFAWHWQMEHNADGHNWYILGQGGSTGWVWYYFPAVLIIKASLPLLVAALILLWRPRAALNWAGGCVLLFLFMSLFYHVQNGLRHLLLVVALAAIIIGAAWAKRAKDAPAMPRPIYQRWLPSLLSLWMIIQTFLFWPHALTYVNALWGGTSQGYRLVSSANYDWGQGLPDLRSWQRRHSQADLVVWYYGTDPSRYQLDAELWQADTWFDSEKQLQTRLKGRFLAISTTLLYGSFKSAICNQDRCNPAIAALRKKQPVARTPTFIIYKFAGT